MFHLLLERDHTTQLLQSLDVGLAMQLKAYGGTRCTHFRTRSCRGSGRSQ